MLKIEDWQAGAGKTLPRPKIKSGTKDGYTVLFLCPRVCLVHYRLKKAGKGGRMERLQTACVGFNSLDAAQKLRCSIEGKRPGAKVIIRESQRVTDFSWELKIWEYAGILEDMLQIAANIQAKEAAKAEMVSVQEAPNAALELDSLIAA
jgi:hypothetical protein